MSEDLIVIGGGLAGIAASLALADETSTDGEKCFNVTLIESGSKLGGRVSSIVDSKTGYKLDNCQHSCFRIYHRFLQLIARSNAFDAIKLQQKTSLLFIDPKTGRSSTLSDGKLAPPNHMLGSMLKFPFLSLKDKVQMRKAVKSMSKLTPEERYKLDDVPFDKWLRENGQTENSIKTFWEFFVKAALNTTIDEASANQAIMLFQYGLFNESDSFDVGAFTNDLTASIHTFFENSLIDAGVNLKFKTSCKSIIWDNGNCKGINTTEGEIYAQKIVIALPQHSAKRILSKENNLPAINNLVNKLEKLEYRALIGLHAIFTEDFLKDDFSFAAMIDEPVIQLIFNRNNELDDENKLPDNKLLLSVPVSAADEFIKWDDDRFKSEFERVIELLWPGSSEKLERFVVVKYPKATFAPLISSKQFRPKSDEIEGGLYLCGDYTDCDWPSTMEGAVRSGLIAASKIIGNMDWDADDKWPNWPENPKRGTEKWKQWR